MESGGGSGGGVRLHVGGLGDTVGNEDLLKIFSPMGSVDSVEFVRTKGRSFAYVDFSPSSTNSLSKLFNTYNGCVWKGGRLHLEKAKEHYLARLKREWEEEEKEKSSSSSSSASAIDNTVRESETPSTHINIFFPRLRKVKPMPLTGTGKHKYSFQRVNVSSSLPKSFCDCEEHSKSVTPMETRVRDLEAVNLGVDEEEVNVMNSVMNKLFQKNNIPITKEENDEQVQEEDSDEKAREEHSEVEEDGDNLIINVVSNGKGTMESELDILTRKRKSISNEIAAIGEYTEGLNGNRVHPPKKRQSIIKEASERQEPAPAIREKKKPSGKDLDEPSRTRSDKRKIDNVSWSQKSSWKSLMANGNSSNFSVSSFLPDVGSSKVVQPASHNTDLPGSSAAKSTVTTKIKKAKSKRPTSTTMASDSSVSDDIEMNNSTATDTFDSDSSKSFEDTATDTDSIATDTFDSDSSKSFEDTATDAVGSDKSEDVEAEPMELALNTQGNSENDKLSLDSDEDVADDMSAETESLVSKDNVDHGVDKEETGKEPAKTGNKSSEGPSWIQKGSWTQLVSEKDASFSITQLFPNLKPEVAKVNNNDQGQFSNPNQSVSGMKHNEPVHANCASVKGIEENKQSLNAKNASEPRRVPVKRPIRRNIGSGETCTFMRSSTSLNEWAKAKKALSEPRRRKKSEEE